MTFTLNETAIIDAFKNDESILQKSKEICNDLLNEKYSISNFVENLGFALTSPTVELRVNGTKLLSTILQNLPTNYLNEKQLNYIVTFYCDRLKDHHNVIPAVLDGILALSKMFYLPNGSCEKLFRNFIQNTTCQSQVREDRLKFYYILESMTEKHSEELKLMQADFIYGVINSIEGERDPRNLMFLFKFMPKFIEKFPLYHLNEEMFETFACYFPIDFQSNKTDSDTITRQQLSDNLANCLIASDEFIEWTITLLLEKLESDLIAAKIDSLELLRRSANKFPSKKLDLHFDTIWQNLKPEIFPGSDNKDIINSGLDALKAILVNAYQQQPNDVSKNMQSTILSTILTHLSDPNHRLFEPACSIGLICVYADSLYSGEKILNTLIIKLHNYDNDDDDDDNDDKNTENTINKLQIIEENTKILNLISKIFYLCDNSNTINQLNTDLCQNIENEYMKFLNKLQNTIEEQEKKQKKQQQQQNLDNEYINALLNCISESIKILNLNNRKKFYKFLIKILINEKFNEINLKNILNKIYKTYCNELKEYFINDILIDFKNYSLQIKENIFMNFLIFIKTTDYEDIILNLIIDNIFNNNNNQMEQEISLKSLKKILLLNNNDDILIKKLYDNYNLLDKMINLARNNDNNYDILLLISSILCLFIKQLNIKEQKYILDKYLSQMNLSKSSDLFLTKGILGYLHENVEINEHFEILLNDLIKLSLESNDENLRKVYHHLLCSLLNKIDDNDKTKGILRKSIEKLKDEIKNDNKKAVEILSWISKGLLVRGHTDAAELIETLAELLDHPKLSNAALLAFEILSIEFPELHLPIVKYLYKQKFFHIVLNKIWHKLSEYSENHMNAFIYVLKMTPHRVLKMNLEKIGPVLFKCLETDKTSTVQITLEIFKNFLNEQDEYFRMHLQHLIPQLIKLTQNSNSMQIRISSIECLEDLTKYPTFTLIPYKHDVIYGLVSALDDKKRLVRNAAVKARNVWFLIG